MTATSNHTFNTHAATIMELAYTAPIEGTVNQGIIKYQHRWIHEVMKTSLHLAAIQSGCLFFHDLAESEDPIAAISQLAADVCSALSIRDEDGNIQESYLNDMQAMLISSFGYTAGDFIEQFQNEDEDLADLPDSDSVCRTCNQEYPDGGDGWDGECPDCADRSAQCPRCIKDLNAECPLCHGTGLTI